MGRDWYNRGGCKSGKKMKRGCVVEDHDGDEEDSSSSSATSSSTTTGCITAVSQFFDFHHFHLRILPAHTNAAAHDRRQHHQPPQSASDSRTLPPRPPRHIPKGLEAPRNSLEEDAFGPSCSNAASVIHQTMQKLDNLNIPMGRIQIKTSTRGEDTITITSTTQTPRESTSNTKKVLLMYSSADDDNNNNTLCSPGPKTPNLVARLMGLDTAISPFPPPSHSPSQRLSSYSYPRRRSCSDNITSGARSLPETPRVSSERRSDVDRHHRFSLQTNKENNVLFEHENMSPRNYAKQILKQVKERVSRRVGMDITNTVNSGSNNKKEIRRDENLLGSGSRSKNRSQTENLNNDEWKQQQQVSSKKINTISLPPKPSIFEEVSKTRAPQKKDQEEKGKLLSVNKKCKKFAGNSMMMMKKEEPFVRASASRAVNNNSSDKKCKKTTPLSLSNNDLQSFLPPHVKRDPSPPAPATKLPVKQALSDDARCSKFTTTSQLSSGSSHSGQQKLAIQVIHKRHVDLENTLHGISNELGLIQYLAALLRRIGINKDTRLVSLSRWFSTSHRHPFDLSIFHHLELAFSALVTGQLRLRCNRG